MPDFPNPFVSVIMTAFNAEKTISDSIESILNQTYPDFELILINDGSSDSTYKIMSQYKESDPRIILINKKNSGVSESRNLGIEIAKGEWLAILDSDDVAHSNRLSEQIKLIDSDIVLIGSDSDLIDTFGNKIKSCTYPNTDIGLRKNLYNFKKFPPHSSLLLRTSSVVSLEGYRKVFIQSEDYDLYVRLSRIGKFASVPQKLICYRVHNNQLSNGQGTSYQRIYSLMSISILNYENDYGELGDNFEYYVYKFISDIKNSETFEHIEIVSQFIYSFKHLSWFVIITKVKNFFLYLNLNKEMLSFSNRFNKNFHSLNV
jgi:glycosyltransferase involved in cell wall biosynthesis